MSKRNQLIYLIKQKAISYGKFKLASGQISDYYIDLSKVVLDSTGLYLISSLVITEVDAWKKVNAVGGPAYGAIPIASGVLVLMHDSNWAMKGFFVRKEIKEHGKEELIEGHLSKGDKVVLVEDVTTTGGSLFKTVLEIQKLGCEVVETISIVDRNQGASELFVEKNLPFKSILNIEEILL